MGITHRKQRCGAVALRQGVSDMTLLSGLLFASLVLVVGSWLLRGLFWWALRPRR